ncbi:MAG: DNA polymerase III subunit epsilon [Enterobacteriaceae bacterium]
MNTQTASVRQIVLDTETTGMNMQGVHYEGHRIVEIGAIEVIDRRLTGRSYHVYLRPDRLIDPEAYLVHGISDDFLADKPRFAAIAQEFRQFIEGAELIIHNAPFDIGFIDQEFGLLGQGTAKVNTFCTVTDTLVMARRLFPGKRNNLDALCERYQIDNSRRTYHGALLDAEILAEVYLAMTGGQTSLVFSGGEEKRDNRQNAVTTTSTISTETLLKVIYASDAEQELHEQRLDLVQKKGGSCLWRC